MNILHTVEFYSPSVGGSQEVVRQISEHLVQFGHSVTVATTKLIERTSKSINGVKIEEFDIAGNSVNGFRGEWQRYQQFLLDGQFDIMMNYAAQEWAADLVFPILPQIPYRKVFIPCGFSGLFDPRYKTYFAQMPDVLKNYDHLVFHASHYRDIDFARKSGLDSFSVIPNGASEKEFSEVCSSFRQRYGIPKEVPLLATVGSHTGLKGHSLVMEAFRQARIGRAILLIIGNIVSGQTCLKKCKRQALWVNMSSLGQKRVCLLDPPRPDVVEALKAADLFVFGSNIEYSPLVLFEAMASGTAYISTACGNAEEITAWSNGGLVIPTFTKDNGTVDAKPEVMAKAIEDLIHDPDMRHSLAETGRRSWIENFTWNKITSQYEHLYNSVVSQPVI